MKNTTGVFAPSWNFNAHLMNFVVLFLAQKTLFSALSAHELKLKRIKKVALKRCMKTFKTKCLFRIRHLISLEAYQLIKKSSLSLRCFFLEIRN